ncbi:MAG: signal recognition particle protein [Desulfatiglandales bacterium]
MFENLTDKLSNIFRKVTGRGRLTEENIKEALREVRLALLEADVNYKVVKDFIQKVQEKAVGQEVLESLTPGQQFIKIVRDELISLMGDKDMALNLSGRPPHVIMLIGLQGSGKTTTAAKLALYLRRKGRRPFLVPADIRRPAAIEQLRKLGSQINVDVYQSAPKGDPVRICVDATEKAIAQGKDTVLLDTAGRLHIDEPLVQELVEIKSLVSPKEVLLVADAMTGQDAVNVAREFHQRVGITGVILTKTEGDARGGAALSIKAVTGAPIKFVGVGEKLDALEVFYPERMASQILGMGDVLTLIEKAQEAFDEKQAKELQKKLMKQKYDLEDFLKHIRQIKKMGSLEQILSMIPGMGFKQKLRDIRPDEKELKRIEAIICSMTREERKNFKIINGSRKRRIAKGSGTTVQEVNRLLKNFQETKKIMEEVSKKGYSKMYNLLK